MLVLSLVATGFLAFGLWVHHMFATGIPQIAESYFTAASMMIAIPSGAQIFCWIATMATGKVVLRTPMWWVLGFFFVFIMGGMTGIFVASVPVDLQVHDTYFVVAHFHYVLIGGAVFPLFGAMTYWFPKVTGRMLSEKLGQVSFWLFFIGFNVTFFPMHLVGHSRYAAPCLHLSRQHGMDVAEPDRVARLHLPLSFGAALYVERLPFAAARRPGRDRIHGWPARWSGPLLLRPRSTTSCICPR